MRGPLYLTTCSPSFGEARVGSQDGNGCRGHAGTLLKGVPPQPAILIELAGVTSSGETLPVLKSALPRQTIDQENAPQARPQTSPVGAYFKLRFSLQKRPRFVSNGHKTSQRREELSLALSKQLSIRCTRSWKFLGNHISPRTFQIWHCKRKGSWYSFSPYQYLPTCNGIL